MNFAPQYTGLRSGEPFEYLRKGGMECGMWFWLET